MIQGIVNVKANVHECPWFGEKMQPKPPKVPHPSCNVDAFALAFSKALGHKRQKRNDQQRKWCSASLEPLEPWRPAGHIKTANGFHGSWSPNVPWWENHAVWPITGLPGFERLALFPRRTATHSCLVKAKALLGNSLALPQPVGLSGLGPSTSSEWFHVNDCL